ncbi:MAG: cellulase family glycosylhydrolase [Pseudomonadota bacterium]
MNTNKLPRRITWGWAMLCSILWLGAPAHAASPMQKYVDAMQPGINLGNTLDAIPDETSWGNPLVTQGLMQRYAAAGYKSIRIPVTWTDHMGPAPMYAVDPAWMDRVQQVVDWALAAGLRVMINEHHDSWQWISAMPTNHDAVLIRFTAVWTQIAERFANYPNTLMFESVNEPQFAGVDDATGRALLDELNTTFFDVVRSSGGMNSTRPLVLPCLHTNAGQENLDSLAATIAKLSDPNLITTTHFYGFWPFSVNIMGYTKFNSPTIDDIVKSFDAVYNTFVAKGIPSVVGEFGVLSNTSVQRGEALKYHEYVTQYARSKRLAHMFWDTGGLIDRTTYQVKDPDLYRTMMQTVKGRATNADTDSIFLNSDEQSGKKTINLNLNGNRFVSLRDGSTTLQQGVDYTIEDSALTIKKRALDKYAAAPFGEKTVLTVNVSSGPAWKVFVRYTGSPELSSASGTTGAALVIPTAFNGDLLATMEARRADGSPAGPANWTPFKEWGVFLPNYTNDTITVTDKFFAGEPAGTINLRFHFWSGRVATYALTLQSGGSSGGEDLTIYDNSLAPGWQSWSWATVNFDNATVAQSAPNSIAVDATAWGSLYLAYQGTPLDTSGYNTLTFWGNGGPSGGQKITVSAAVNFNGDGLPSYTIESLPANTWQKYEIPLAALGVQGSSNISNFGFMNTSGGTEPTFYIDEIKLSPTNSSTLLHVTGLAMATTPPSGSFKIRDLNVEKDDGCTPLQHKVRVRNTGTQPALGPIYLVLKGLSPNTTLVNATGLTGNIVPAGEPYILVTTGTLVPDQKAKVTLDFSAPRPGGDITYTPRVLSDGMAP